MNKYEYNFWDDRTHELDTHPCRGCKDLVDGECISNGGCGSSDYQKIIYQLERLKEHCSDMAKGGEEVWKEDESALQEAMDIIHDYESVIASHNRMVEHYETADMTIKRQTGVYVCPSCGKRVYIGHSHCHWCGKKVCWDKEAYESRNNPR